MGRKTRILELMKCNNHIMKKNVKLFVERELHANHYETNIFENFLQALHLIEKGTIVA